MMRRMRAGLFMLLVLLPTRGMPQSSSPPPISPATLRDALLALTDDSLGRRLTGSRGAAKAASFIEQSLIRLGVRPAGDQGKFTQEVPVVRRQIDSANTSLKTQVNDGEFVLTYWFKYGVDYQPFTAFGGLTFPPMAEGGEVIFGGRLGTPGAVTPGRRFAGDSSSVGVAGKTVIFLPPLRANGEPDYQVWNMTEILESYSLARALLVISLDLMPASVRRAMDRPYFALRNPSQSSSRVPPVIAISKATAFMMLAGDAEAMEANWRNARPRALVRQSSAERAPEAPVRNIVAMIEGRDSVLKSEYVVLTAQIDQADVSEFETDMRSVWPLDRESSANGANAASGAVALLEIARQMSAQGIKPRRSVVFLWTVGREHGRLGAEWFAEHPPIPREKIVAHIDLDLIGGRDPRDSTGGRGHLEVRGTHLGSSQFRTWIDDVNGTRFNFVIDEPAALGYCTNDQWSFAKRGIPSASLTTAGGFTDDVATIDFTKLGRVTEFAGALAIDVANRPSRPVVVKGRDPSPRAACVQ
jgi:hypothetical protein